MAGRRNPACFTPANVKKLTMKNEENICTNVGMYGIINT